MYAPNFPFEFASGHVISVSSMSPNVAITLYNVTLCNAQLKKKKNTNPFLLQKQDLSNAVSCPTPLIYLMGITTE